MANFLPPNAIPDDTAVSDLPRGQVDYLSHEWREEDVWRSWRSMTRLKNEIANGVRLENASWRTWWKQRNNLSTVSPETLNWLKDSDVTWLYGPLHTADYPTPTPKPSPNTAAALDLPIIPGSPPTTKPILKHRSIMELLTSDLPSSPIFSPPDSDEEQIFSDNVHTTIIKRPPLIHTKSDTHITHNRIFRRDSPPRIIASGTPITTELPPSSRQTSSSDPLIVPGQKRKHISFNTFVEQCIAIEKPKKKRTMWNLQYQNSNTVGSSDYSFEDDGYDEDSEDGIIDETDELLFGDEDDRTQTPSHIQQSYPRTTPSHPRSSPPPQNPSPVSSSTSDEEDEDEVLEMRVRHANAATLPPRSSSHSSSSTSSSSSRSRPPKARSASYSDRTNGSASRNRRPSANGLMRTASSDKELITIALIAPTTLKTRAEEDEPYASSHGYPHPLSGGEWYAYGAQDSPVELVYVPPSYACADADGVADEIMAEPYHNRLKPGQFFDGPLVASPSPDDVPMKEDDACAYFEEHERVENVLPYTGNVPVTQNLGRPEVVVTEDTPTDRQSRSKSRSRSRSKSHSRSRTPSPSLASIQVQMPPPSTAVPVSRSSSQTPSTSGQALLSPPDAPRGRNASSSSLQGEQKTRGRSITRTSSFSDRDSISEGAESPLGSLSPDGGFGLAIGIGGGYTGGRERGDRSRLGLMERERERGRGVGRRIDSNSGSASSLSPEGQSQRPVVVVPAVVSAPPEVGPALAPPPKKKFTSASSSSSDSSTVSVSTMRPSPRLVVNMGPAPAPAPAPSSASTPTPTSVPTSTPTPTPASVPVTSSSTTIPTPTQAQSIKEEQECISRQPTPANSPVLAMRPALPSLKAYSYAAAYNSHPTAYNSNSTAYSNNSNPTAYDPRHEHNPRHERKASTGTSTSRSPTRGEQGGTLVGRAVEIMSNAGAFLNAFWHSGAQAQVQILDSGPGQREQNSTSTMAMTNPLSTQV
ncbi:uncharacterized protein EDB91DRAFT_619301 [Suillus paluster]|uniref:uncharacterized protein n=1 Tax=Suillus paluster TaxID=48578 RepID=UPI001B8827CE|nr:uncharacterized protein EDB91DRAFT_619301 [Suillus paluster]KAG1734027.1 hypothetical protein EDB91DRAFT_619301 [Suillus paluster]